MDSSRRVTSREGGVFRVDYRTGALSICYLYFQRGKAGRSRGDCGPICRMHAAVEAGERRPGPFRRRGQRTACGRPSARLTRLKDRCLRPKRRSACARAHPLILRRSASGGPRRILQSARMIPAWSRPSRRAFGAPQDEAARIGRLRLDANRSSAGPCSPTITTRSSRSPPAPAELRSLLCACPVPAVRRRSKPLRLGLSFRTAALL